MTSWLYQLLIILILPSILIGCSSSRNDETNNIPSEKKESKNIKYATNFNISSSKSGKVLTVINPWEGNTKPFIYKLVNRDVLERKTVSSDTVYVSSSINKIVCLSTTHVGYISALNSEQLIAGLSGGEWVCDPKIQQMRSEGTIKEVGRNMSYDYETIIDLQPDIVFAYGINQKSMEYIQKLMGYNIPVVIISEFMENHPLGKAEWIKFFGEFLNRSEAASDFFNNVEKEYLELTAMAVKSEDNPKVFTGLPWKGDWYVPGGKSFQAALFKDAGADYLWKKDENTSGMVVDIEVVFNKALEANYWINLNDVKFKYEIEALDDRYAHFKAFKQGNLFNNNARKNEAGGNDYWESGVVRPDLVLKDLIKIFHPDVLKDHQLFYYQRLN